MKQILKILLCSFCFISVSAKASKLLPGPPMICGDKKITGKTYEGYEETTFLILQQRENDLTPYYVLYRNKDTGSWTLIAHNIPKMPTSISCILNGGLFSSIMSDKTEVVEMLNKQVEGLDKPIDPNKNKIQKDM